MSRPHSSLFGYDVFDRLAHGLPQFGTARARMPIFSEQEFHDLRRARQAAGMGCEDAIHSEPAHHLDDVLDIWWREKQWPTSFRHCGNRVIRENPWCDFPAFPIARTAGNAAASRASFCKVMNLQPLARLKIGEAFFTPASNSASMPGFTSICAISSIMVGSLQLFGGGIMGDRLPTARVDNCDDTSKRAQPPQRPITREARCERNQSCHPCATLGVLEWHILGIHAEETSDQRRRQQTRRQNREREQSPVGHSHHFSVEFIK